MRRLLIFAISIIWNLPSPLFRHGKKWHVFFRRVYFDMTSFLTWYFVYLDMAYLKNMDFQEMNNIPCFIMKSDTSMVVFHMNWCQIFVPMNHWMDVVSKSYSTDKVWCKKSMLSKVSDRNMLKFQLFSKSNNF